MREISEGDPEARILAWMRVIRLQFYPMAFLAYTLGAVAAVSSGGSLNRGLFWLGYLTMFGIELGTVLFNEVYDQDTDIRNRNRSPFTGGSGMVVDGRLADSAVRRAACVSFGFAGLAALITLFTSHSPDAFKLLAYLVVGAGLGMGYTVPPVRLSARGWGELTVGFTHSLYLIGYGYLLQSGDLMRTEVVLLALPVFFSVLAAILLAGLPDLGADMNVGKQTLAVRCGPQTVSILAACASLFSVAAIFFQVVYGILSVSVAGLFVICSGLHALVLIVSILRVVARKRFDTRIDIVLQLALSHILWTVCVPLIGLW
jgi:1,4-dihydroxy-2-naphthoate octaprenyltransferase